jgi:catechol 2,3-dioxygenase-like lactoylglutathione lyase family enzyme
MIDCDDPDLLARFWCDVLGYRVVFRSDSMVAIAASQDSHPGLGFVRVDEPKTGKNRLHLDLLPDDQETEVRRLLALGASRADIGQDGVPWVVLRDPEGNELCVLGQ